jgi:hypothetical protein
MWGIKYAHCPACGKINRLFSETKEFDKSIRRLCDSCGNRSVIDEWFAPVMKKTWIIQVLGKYSDCEISIVRMNNLHGRLSHGWESEDKIILGKSNEHTHYILREAACKLAYEKNTQENNQ